MLRRRGRRGRHGRGRRCSYIYVPIPVPPPPPLLLLVGVVVVVAGGGGGGWWVVGGGLVGGCGFWVVGLGVWVVCCLFTIVPDGCPDCFFARSQCGPVRTSSDASIDHSVLILLCLHCFSSS